MSPDEVVALMGEEQTYEDWMGGNLNDSLLYHHLIIGFDKYDGLSPVHYLVLRNNTSQYLRSQRSLRYLKYN